MARLTNQRHELFAQGIAQGKPASRAYIEAGYKARGNAAETNAARLLRKAQVQERLAEIAAQIESHAIADAEEVQKFLTAVMRGEVTEELLDRDSRIRTLKSLARDRIKAAELLGRAQGVFVLSSQDASGELDAIAQALARVPDDDRPPPVLN